MKKTLLFTILTFSVGLFFASCSDNNDKDYLIEDFQIDTPNGGIYQIRTHDTLLINPGVELSESDRLIWTLNDKLISGNRVLSFVSQDTGTFDIKLQIVDTENYTKRYSSVRVNVSTKYEGMDINKFDLSDGIVGEQGNYWKGTFNDPNPFKTGIFTFSHTDGQDTTWLGHTVSNWILALDYGYNKTLDTWFTRQWGTMPSKGLTGRNFIVQRGGRIAQEEINKGIFHTGLPTWVKVGEDDEKDAFKAVSISLSNSPWAFHSMTRDEKRAGYPRKYEARFQDYMRVNIYGVDKNNRINLQPVTHYMADYRDSMNIKKPSIDWENVDLTTLGEVKYLLFQLETNETVISETKFITETSVVLFQDTIKNDKGETTSIISRSDTLKVKVPVKEVIQPASATPPYICIDGLKVERILQKK